MGRPIRALALSLVVTLAAGASVAAPGAMSIDVRDSKRVSLSATPANIIVGDPNVADVAMVDSRSMVITAHGYGVTHIMAMDAKGHLLFDRRIAVIASSEGLVTVHRAMASDEYSCTPQCSLASGSHVASTMSAAELALSGGVTSRTESTRTDNTTITLKEEH